MAARSKQAKASASARRRRRRQRQEKIHREVLAEFRITAQIAVTD